MKGKLLCFILGHRWIQDEEVHYVFICSRCERTVIFKYEYPSPRRIEDSHIRDYCIWCYKNLKIE